MKRPYLRNTRPFTIRKTELTAIATAGGPRSLVDQLFIVITNAIKNQNIGHGMRMPSVRQLAEDCEISPDTAARAYDKLVANGFLESRRGSGFFVRAQHSHKRNLEKTSPLSQHFADARYDVLRFRMMLLKSTSTLQSYSGIGYLPESWMDENSIASELRTVARGNQRVLAQLGDVQGYLPLRNQLQLKLHDLGIYTNPENIILTNGATDALNLVIQTYLQSPGEYVLVENPVQPLLTNRLMANGLDFACVPRLNNGPDLVVLRELCEKYHPRFFFCNSILHNPTGTHLSPPIAFQLLQLAEEFDFTIVEDDTYGDLLPQGLATTPTRLAPLDQLKRVIYIGSFSKTIAPGLRVGYLAANLERIEWLSFYRNLNCIANNSLAERTVYRLLSQGNYRHHCEQLRTRISYLRPLVTTALTELGFEVENAPDAGIYLWVNLGEDVDAFAVAQRMLEQNHLTAPGMLFSTEIKHKSYMRFNITNTLENNVLPSLARLLGR